ncbi:MAG: cyclic nucleotide-binding domain-containing protein [Chloroflexaceae bacterium]|nr:cyclic nucleotide-binding domain-containing protein [Chloroflexaceae bacterium]NJO07663.1 cyclic nucleotide-binding domain-containing protein [Chloroflexaceae bacterium]
MSDGTAMDSLRRVQIFGGLNDQELLKIANLCEIWRVATGHVVFSEGEDGDRLFIIHEGSVRVTIQTTTPDGKPTQGTINMLYAGQSFGELVLLDGNTRSATVVAASSSVLLAIKEREFSLLCEANPRIGYRVMRNLASDLAYKLRSSNLLLRGNIRWKHNELAARPR